MPQLTPSQKARIEQNRQAALERRAARKRKLSQANDSPAKRHKSNPNLSRLISEPAQHAAPEVPRLLDTFHSRPQPPRVSPQPPPKKKKRLNPFAKPPEPTRFIAVTLGREIGVFTDTDKVDALCDGFPGADYEIFSTRAEAEARMEEVYRENKEYNSSRNQYHQPVQNNNRNNYSAYQSSNYQRPQQSNSFSRGNNLSAQPAAQPAPVPNIRRKDKSTPRFGSKATPQFGKKKVTPKFGSKKSTPKFGSKKKATPKFGAKKTFGAKKEASPQKFGQILAASHKPSSLQFNQPTQPAFQYRDFQQPQQPVVKNQPIRLHRPITLTIQIVSVNPLKYSLTPQRVVNELSNFLRGMEITFDRSKKYWDLSEEQYSQIKKQVKQKFAEESIDWKEPAVKHIRLAKGKWHNQFLDPEQLRPELNKLPEKLLGTLYEFQKTGFLYGISREGRVLIADEMGLGKSIQALAIASYYKEEWPLLIVTPSSLRLTWYEEIRKWKIAKACNIQVVKKGKDSFDSRVVIISYDLAARNIEKLMKLRWGVAICDESHYIKNRNTSRYKALSTILQQDLIKRVVFLTGTPTSNRPAELWTQANILRKYDFLAQRTFEKRYCNGHNARWGWEAKGAENLQELHCLLRERIMIRRRKNEVKLQLPNKRRRPVLVFLKDKDRKKLHKAIDMKRAEREMKHRFEGDADGGKSFGGSSQSIMELFHETGKAKLPAVCEYLKTVWESFPAGEKLLIWAHHHDVLNGLEGFLRRELSLSTGQYVRIDGKVGLEEKQRRVNAFQRQSNVRIALLGIKAVGVGVTLTKASFAIFAELLWNPSNLRQAEDRLHRIGQEKNVEIQYMLAKDSLDEKMWMMLEEKMKVTDELLEGGIQDRSNAEKMHVQRAEKEIEIKIEPLTQQPRKRTAPDQSKMTDFFRRS